ncbi:hypothetical protein [Streptomyces sp. NPDC048196]|uniref:hypothetical protein n=1 Tax=Streptomyces sp. NPDC048196 TaxID=3154712 RepID=UPI0033DD8090
MRPPQRGERSPEPPGPPDPPSLPSPPSCANCPCGGGSTSRATTRSASAVAVSDASPLSAPSSRTRCRTDSNCSAVSGGTTLTAAGRRATLRSHAFDRRPTFSTAAPATFRAASSNASHTTGVTSAMSSCTPNPRGSRARPRPLSRATARSSSILNSPSTRTTSSGATSPTTSRTTSRTGTPPRPPPPAPAPTPCPPAARPSVPRTDSIRPSPLVALNLTPNERPTAPTS